MPTGIPVATVAVNGAGNAAHLAAQMLALSDEILAAKLEEGKKKMEEEVVLKDQKMQQMADEI
jgi:5-(carboxyamino)imidazole ribonucleotide mutase